VYESVCGHFVVAVHLCFYTGRLQNVFVPDAVNGA